MATKFRWQDMVYQPFPKDAPITNETVETTKKFSSRFRGSVRLARGMFWTDDAFEQRRKIILETKLP